MVKFRLLEFDAELSVSDFAEFSQKNFRNSKIAPNLTSISLNLSRFGKLYIL